ncbi:hypothetical protein IWZ00DRAFT_503055 [Phyllosticta capitalensis]
MRNLIRVLVKRPPSTVSLRRPPRPIRLVHEVTKTLWTDKTIPASENVHAESTSGASAYVAYVPDRILARVSLADFAPPDFPLGGAFANAVDTRLAAVRVHLWRHVTIGAEALGKVVLGLFKRQRLLEFVFHADSEECVPFLDAEAFNAGEAGAGVSEGAFGRGLARLDEAFQVLGVEVLLKELGLLEEGDFALKRNERAGVDGDAVVFVGARQHQGSVVVERLEDLELELGGQLAKASLCGCWRGGHVVGSGGRM